MASFFCHVDGVAMQFRLERIVRQRDVAKNSDADKKPDAEVLGPRSTANMTGVSLGSATARAGYGGVTKSLLLYVVVPHFTA